MIIAGELGSCIAGVVSWGVGCATEGIPGKWILVVSITMSISSITGSYWFLL